MDPKIPSSPLDFSQIKRLAESGSASKVMYLKGNSEIGALGFLGRRVRRLFGNRRAQQDANKELVSLLSKAIVQKLGVKGTAPIDLGLAKELSKLRESVAAGKDITSREVRAIIKKVEQEASMPTATKMTQEQLEKFHENVKLLSEAEDLLRGGKEAIRAAEGQFSDAEAQLREGKEALLRKKEAQESTEEVLAGKVGDELHAKGEKLGAKGQKLRSKAEKLLNQSEEKLRQGERMQRRADELRKWQEGLLKEPSASPKDGSEEKPLPPGMAETKF